MRSFVSRDEVEPLSRIGDHGGIGPMVFRRLLGSGQFISNLDFIDLSVIPPGSTIGRHEHFGNEELYCVLRGEPLVRVNGSERRLTRGDIAVVRSGQWHELVNDTHEEVEIVVVQVHL